MDSIVHFYKNDLEKEKALVDRIVAQMKMGAVLVNCLLKSKKAESVLKNIIQKHTAETVYEGYTEYPEFGAVYHLLAVRKQTA